MKDTNSILVANDVKALIADCHAEIEHLKQSIERWGAIGTSEHLSQLQSRLKRQYLALESLESKPFAYVHPNMLNDLVDKARACGRVWINENDEVSGEARIPVYTKIPAQMQCSDEFQEDNPWIKWEGGECPVDGAARVELQWNNGDFSRGRASNFGWQNRINQGYHSITAYREVSFDS